MTDRVQRRKEVTMGDYSDSDSESDDVINMDSRPSGNRPASLKQTVDECVQKCITSKGAIESPVIFKEPMKFHEVLVMTFPVELYKVPLNTFLSFQDEESDSKSMFMHRLVHFTVETLRLSCISKKNTPEDADSEGQTPANGKKGKKGVDYNLHIDRNKRISKFYVYFEQLATKNSSCENDEDNELLESDIETATKVRSDSDYFDLAGIRMFIFNKDTTISLGKQMEYCVSVQKNISAGRNSLMDLYGPKHIPNDMTKVFTGMFESYIDDPNLLAKDRSHAALHSILSSSNNLSPDAINRRLHPTIVFNPSTAMRIYTKNVDPKQTTLNNYFNNLERHPFSPSEKFGTHHEFVGFPYPRLVTYVPLSTMIDYNLMTTVPALNSYLDSRNKNYGVKAARSLTGAIANDITMTAGFSDISMSIIDPATKRRQTPEIQKMVEAIENEVDQAFVRASTPARARSQLNKEEGSSLQNSMYTRSANLYERLINKGAFEELSKKYTIEHPLHNEIMTYAKLRAIDKYWEIVKSGKVPGPMEKLREWFFALPAHKQLMNWQHDHNDISTYANIKGWFYYIYEKVFKVHTNHAALYYTHLASFSSGEFSFRTITHVSLTGDAGSGKSYMLKVLENMAAPGLILKLSCFTAKAFTPDNDEGTDVTIIMHEADLSMQASEKNKKFRGNDGVDAENQTLKQMMSEGYVTGREYKSRDTGDEARSSRNHAARLHCSFAVATNNSATDGPMSNRFRFFRIAAKNREDKYIGDDSGFQYLLDTPVNREFSHRVKLVSFYMYIVYKAIENGCVSEVNTETFSIFKPLIEKSINQRFGAKNRNRIFETLEGQCISATILTALFKTLFCEIAEYRWRKDKVAEDAGRTYQEVFTGFNPRSLLWLERYLTVTTEIVADIFTHQAEEMIPLSEMKIAQAIASRVDLNNPVGTMNRSAIRFFITPEGTVDYNYAAIPWHSSTTPTTINNLLSPEDRIGPRNVSTLIDKLKTLFSSSLKYKETVVSSAEASTLGIAEGSVIIKEDLNSEFESIPLACFKSGKTTINTRSTKLASFLLIHVSVTKQVIEEIIPSIVKDVFQYAYTEPNSAIITALPTVEAVKKVVLANDGLLTPEDENRPSTSNDVYNSIYMPQLSRILILQPDKTKHIIKHNSNQMQKSDYLKIGPVREQLTITEGYVVDKRLDKIREQAAFTISRNVDKWSAFVQVHNCKLNIGVENVSQEVSDAMLDVYSPYFMERIKAYRAKNVDKFKNTMIPYTSLSKEVLVSIQSSRECQQIMESPHSSTTLNQHGKRIMEVKDMFMDDSTSNFSMSQTSSQPSTSTAIVPRSNGADTLLTSFGIATNKIYQNEIEYMNAHREYNMKSSTKFLAMLKSGIST